MRTEWEGGRGEGVGGRVMGDGGVGVRGGVGEV